MGTCIPASPDLLLFRLEDIAFDSKMYTLATGFDLVVLARGNDELESIISSVMMNAALLLTPIYIFMRIFDLLE
jgi:hypothetical protein